MTTNESASERSYPDIDRLFTPWRLTYVEGFRPTTGCVFCELQAFELNENSLVLHRANHSYVVMNLFPYSTGHLLIVPGDHVASPEELGIEALHEIAELLPVALKAIRLALTPAGFNVGYNLGVDAGAGIAGHLHQHVVPRWRGDANFMPIVASTKVLPELLPVTWAKLRPEFARESFEQINVLATNRSTGQVLIDHDSKRIPTFSPEPGLAVWRQALNLLNDAGTSASLHRWIEADSWSALVFDVEPPARTSASYAWIDPRNLPCDMDRALISQAQR